MRKAEFSFASPFCQNNESVEPTNIIMINQRAKPIIPQVIPPVAMPEVQPLFFATAPKIIAKRPVTIGSKKNETIPKTKEAIARPLPGIAAGTPY